MAWNLSAFDNQKKKRKKDADGWNTAAFEKTPKRQQRKPLADPGEPTTQDILDVTGMTPPKKMDIPSPDEALDFNNTRPDPTAAESTPMTSEKGTGDFLRQGGRMAQGTAGIITHPRKSINSFRKEFKRQGMPNILSGTAEAGASIAEGAGNFAEEGSEFLANLFVPGEDRFDFSSGMTDSIAESMRGFADEQKGKAVRGSRNAALEDYFEGKPSKEEQSAIDRFSDPEYVWGDLMGGTVASYLPAVAAGIAGTAVAGPAGGFAAGGATGALIEGGAAMSDAKYYLRNHEDPAKRRLAENQEFINDIGILTGTGAVVLQGTPIGRVLSRSPIGKYLLKQSLRRFGVELAKQGGKAALDEGVTEGFQQILGNSVAQIYNENQGAFEGVLDAALGGAIAGGGMGTAQGVSEVARDLPAGLSVEDVSGDLSNDILLQEAQKYDSAEEFIEVKTNQFSKQIGNTTDEKLNIKDFYDELVDNGAIINEDGTIKLFHRTTKENAEKIKNSKKIFGDENGVFFSTSKSGQAEGFGNAILELNVPVNKIELDDVFGTEAHVKIPTKKAGQEIDISSFQNTKSQLSDIYNQANEESIESSEVKEERNVDESSTISNNVLNYGTEETTTSDGGVEQNGRVSGRGSQPSARITEQIRAFARSARSEDPAGRSARNYERAIQAYSEEGGDRATETLTEDFLEAIDTTDLLETEFAFDAAVMNFAEAAWLMSPRKSFSALATIFERAGMPEVHSRSLRKVSDAMPDQILALGNPIGFIDGKNYGGLDVSSHPNWQLLLNYEKLKTVRNDIISHEVFGHMTLVYSSLATQDNIISDITQLSSEDIKTVFTETLIEASQPDDTITGYFSNQVSIVSAKIEDILLREAGPMMSVVNDAFRTLGYSKEDGYRPGNMDIALEDAFDIKRKIKEYIIENAGEDSMGQELSDYLDGDSTYFANELYARIIQLSTENNYRIVSDMIRSLPSESVVRERIQKADSNLSEFFEEVYLDNKDNVFYSSDDPGLSNEIPEIESEVLFELERAEAGDRYQTESGEMQGYSSSFPDWVPAETENAKNLRSKELFNQVLELLDSNERPNGSRQAELMSIIADEISRRLGPELANERNVNEYVEYVREQDQNRTITNRQRIRQRAIEAAQNADQRTTTGKETGEVIERTTEGKATKMSDFIRKKESTLLKERIKNYRRGVREGVRTGKERGIQEGERVGKERGVREGERMGRRKVTERLKEINNIIDNSGLSLKDKGKLRKKPKQVAEKKGRDAFLGVVDDVISQIERLEQAEQSRTVKNHIKKTLKKTKTKTQSGKVKGKYTPEIQEVLDVMRDSVKLTIDQAEQKIQQNIEKYTDKIPPLEVQMENKVLSMVAGRLDTADMKGLLDDITALIDEGRQINALKDFNKKSELQRKTEHVVDAVTGGEGIDPTLATTGEKKRTTLEKIKVSLKTLGKKWVANWEGLMNILDWNANVDNKTLADMFNVNAENNAYKSRQTDQSENLKEMLVESYGVEDKDFAVRRKIIELQEDVNLGVFENANKNEVEIEMTRDEMIKRWMELQDPSLEASFEQGNLYTNEIIDAIDNALTAEDKTLGRNLLQAYQKQYTDINKVYSSIYGVNLPQNEYYSPIRREGFQIDNESSLGPFMEEQSFRNAVSSSALQARVKNNLPIKKQGAIGSFEQHMTNTNYFIAWADKVRELQSVFTDPEVRSVVKNTFNKSTLDAIGNTIEDFATNGNRNVRNIAALDWFRKKFAVGVLSVKPAIAIKQLTSTVAYWEEMSITDWVAGVSEFYKNPVKNYRILKEESAFVKSRGSNLERDIKDAQDSDVYQRYTKSKSFINTIMMNVTVGDMGAVASGSWAMRRARLKQYEKEGMSPEEAKRQAIEDYERFGNATQQSSDLSELSEVQRGGSFAKVFTMFKSAPVAYLRKEINVVQSLFQEGGFKRQNLQKVAKTMAIYHIMLPMFFQWVSDFGEFDEDEQARAVLLGSVNGAFIVGDAVTGVVRTALGLQTWSNEIPIYQLPNSISKFVKNVNFDEIGDEDFYDALEALAEAGSGLGVPTEQVWDMSDGVANLLEGNAREGIGNLAGWSDYALQQSDDDFTPEILEGRGGGDGIAIDTGDMDVDVDIPDIEVDIPEIEVSF